MAGEVIENISSAVESISTVSSLESSLSLLITLLQILGGLLGLYLIYWTIKLIISSRRAKTLDKILIELKEINKKLGKK